MRRTSRYLSLSFDDMIWVRLGGIERLERYTSDERRRTV